MQLTKESLNELALFAGAGGGILGGHLLGWRTVCAVEWEAYPASVLCARQNDGILPPFPIWDDVQTFDGTAWNGIVDVVSGGFPCQDISAAGKGAGIGGGRSGMWKHMARIICEVEPRYVYVENSPMLTSRGIDTVLKDLATIGYDAEWGVFSAAQVGAPHLRKRIWIVAKRGQFFSHTKHNRDGWWKQQQKSVKETNGMADSRCKYGESWDTTRMDCKTQIRSSSAIQFESSSKGQIPDTNSTQCKRVQFTQRKQPKYANFSNSCWWEAEPNVGRVVNGMADRVDRLKAIGNGQVPLCAATAFKLLKERLENGRN